MTRDEILEMPAGREMDALVAEQVMRWSNCQKCEYATWLPDKTVIASGEQWRGNPQPVGIIEEVEDKINPRWYPIKNYSTDIDAAWQVWRQMKDGQFFEFAHELARIIGNGAPEAYVDFLYGINAETICRAAILATTEKT